jgi:GNAT superfamily N-acetyltransferase
MKIRKAKRKDLKEIGKLMLKELSKPPFNEKASMKEVTKSLEFYFKKAEIYISLEEGEITGVLVFQIEQWWEGKVAIVQDLVVKEESQNKGLGKEIINFLEDYCKKKEIKKIEFQTNKKSKAVKFYEKKGYKINKDRISMSKKVI